MLLRTRMCYLSRKPGCRKPGCWVFKIQSIRDASRGAEPGSRWSFSFEAARLAEADMESARGSFASMAQELRPMHVYMYVYTYWHTEPLAFTT